MAQIRVSQVKPSHANTGSDPVFTLSFDILMMDFLYINFFKKH